MKLSLSLFWSCCILVTGTLAQDHRQESFSAELPTKANKSRPSHVRGRALPSEDQPLFQESHHRELQRVADICTENPTPFNTSLYITHIGDDTPFTQTDLNTLALMVLNAFNQADAQSCDTTYRTLRAVTVGNVFYTDSLDFIRLRYDVSGFCDGCLPENAASGIGPLFGGAEETMAVMNQNDDDDDDDEDDDRRRRIKGVSRKNEHRQLQKQDKKISRICDCENDDLEEEDYRGPTASEFTTVLNQFIEEARTQNTLSGVASVENVFEAGVAGTSSVVPVGGGSDVETCAREDNEDFTTSIWIEAEGTTLSDDEIVSMEVAVVETFNEMNLVACDAPQFRITSRAQLEDSRVVEDRIQMLFTVRGKCVNCDPTTLTLFDASTSPPGDASVATTFRAPSRSRLVSEIERVQEANQQPVLVVRDVDVSCACPLNQPDLPYRSPTASEFAQILDATVRILIDQNLTTSVTQILDVEENRQLDTDAPTTVAPTTAAPTTPAPVPVTPAPVPVTPAPVPVTPAPVPVTPAPIPVTPAPVPVTPAPVPVTPAPVPVTPAPVPVTPAPVAEETEAPIGGGDPLDPFEPVGTDGVCGEGVEEFVTSVFVDFDGRPSLLEQSEVIALEDAFQEVYNSLLFENCDLYYRQIEAVTLTPGVARRRLQFTTGGATNSSQVVDLQSALPSVYSVVGRCRRCPVSRAGSFSLFDDAFRRRLQRMDGKNVSLPCYSYASTQSLNLPAFMELDSVGNQERYLQEPDTCVCAPEATADEPYAPSAGDFTSRYNNRVVELKAEGLVTNINAITALQELPPGLLMVGFSVFYGSLQRIGEPPEEDFARLMVQTNAFFRKVIVDYYEDNSAVDVLAVTMSRQGDPTRRPDLDRLRVDFTVELILSEDSTLPSKDEVKIVMENADYVEYIVDYLWTIQPTTNAFRVSHTVRFSETEAVLVDFPIRVTPAAANTDRKPSKSDNQILLDALSSFFKDFLVDAGLPVVRFTTIVDAEDITYDPNGVLRMDITGNTVFTDDAVVPAPADLLAIIQSAILEEFRVDYLGSAPTTGGTGYFSGVVSVDFA